MSGSVPQVTAKQHAGRGRRGLALLAIALLLPGLGLALGLFGSPAVYAADSEPTQRTVQGKVLGAGGTPLAGSIVYLKNQKTTTISSYISGADGSYRFGQVPPDIDFSVWAEFQGKKSPTKNISSLDSKKLYFINLHIDTAK